MAWPYTSPVDGRPSLNDHRCRYAGSSGSADLCELHRSGISPKLRPSVQNRAAAAELLPAQDDQAHLFWVGVNPTPDRPFLTGDGGKTGPAERIEPDVAPCSSYE